MVHNNLGIALAELSRRIGGSKGEALLGQAVAAWHAALEVQSRAEHPVHWAATQKNLALAHEARAEFDTCTDPTPHLSAALDHVASVLTVYDPVHMPYDYGTTTALRDRLLARLAEVDNS